MADTPNQNQKADLALTTPASPNSPQVDEELPDGDLDFSSADAMPDGDADLRQPANNPNNLTSDDDLPDGEADIAARERQAAMQAAFEKIKATSAPLAGTTGDAAKSDAPAEIPIVGAVEGGSIFYAAFVEQLRQNVSKYISERKLEAEKNAGLISSQSSPLPAESSVLSVGDELRYNSAKNSPFGSYQLDTSIIADTQKYLASEYESSLAYKTIVYEDSLRASRESGSLFEGNPNAEIGLPKLIRYAEGDDGNFPSFVLDQLVYIQGVEISKYLKGSVSISKNNVTGHNTLTFTLDNAHDQFVWTDRNLSGTIFKRSYYYDSEGHKREYTKKKDGSSDFFLPLEEIKKEIFNYKADPKINPITIDAVGNIMFPRFDLVPNKCIFNRMDPIRVFSLYPFRPTGQRNPALRELWMPEFCGFIETVSIEDDDVLGTSTITLECSDIRQSVLQKMRISNSVSSSMEAPLDVVGFRPLAYYNGPNITAGLNSGLARRNQALADALLGGTSDVRFFSPTKDNVVFYDDVVNSPYSSADGLDANLNFEESVKQLLVFRRDALIEGKSRRGVNHVEFGGLFRFDNGRSQEECRKYLQDYHTFCLFGPKRRPWTRSEVEEVGKGTTTTGTFWPLRCRLWILLPASSSGPSNLADLSTVNLQLVHQANWTTRLEILRNLVESLDYQMYVSGTGDIHVEFPFADFRPEDFGEYKQVFRFDKATITTSYSDEAEEPTAGLIVTTGFGAAAQPASKLVEVNYQSIFAFSPYIAARYGVTVGQPIPMPFLTYKDKAVAQQRAAVEMQKANARTHTLQMQSSYRPFLLPNRPVHNLRRSRMGTIVTMETTFEIGEQPKASVSVGLEHVRTWTGGYTFEQATPPADSAPGQELQTTGTNPQMSLDTTTTTVDPIETQVFATVMAGCNTPTSTRRSWSSDSVLSGTSGVYLLDLQKFKTDQAQNQPTPTPTTTPTPEEAKAEGEKKTEPPRHVFAENPLKSMVVIDIKGSPRKHGPHAGIDLRARIPGTKTYAVDPGVVTVRNGEDGLSIVLTTDSGYEVEYIHLKEVVNGINGKRVTAGQHIAGTGTAGSAPHLHIEIRKKGSPDVPASYIDPLDPPPNGMFPGPVERA